MATQFVKWWKTKFLRTHHHHHNPYAGYNTMSVLGSDGNSDGRPSDTEDLLRDDVSSCHNNGAHVNGGLASTTASSADNSSICSSDHQIHHHHQDEHGLISTSQNVKFEDFECDLQVEESESGEERKEFSFTFYDLDGHGKITKDDIAGLVRSIYGVVNESIVVPQGGKKTIKVRLTVTPGPDEVTLRNNATNNNTTPTHPIIESEIVASTEMGCIASANQKHPGPDSGPTSGRSKRNNVNVTIHENFTRHASERHRQRQHHSERPRFHSVRIPSSARVQGHSDCRGCRNVLPEVLRDCGASPMRHRKKWRERHSSRPGLSELIQANMEKNNVYSCCRTDNQQIQHNRNSRTPHTCCTHNHFMDSQCPVLSHLNNDNRICKEKLTDSTHPCGTRGVKFTEIIPGAKLTNSSFKGQILCRKHGHHRSKSHDLGEIPFKDQLLGDNRDFSKGTPLNYNNYQYHHHCSQEESLEILTGCILNTSTSSPRNKNTNTTNNNKNLLNTVTPLPGAATPHQLKHKNREENHARAMAQVIDWLERENIGDKNTTPSPSKLCFQHHPSSSPNRQEHHHVHEHIHHHYHHHFAKETPIIV